MICALRGSPSRREFVYTGPIQTERIAALLEPFLSSPLSLVQTHSIATYIDLLIRWNARINLTAIRDPDQIVTRHFGESLFAARILFPSPENSSASTNDLRVTDVGSGAGFPGLPIKLWCPGIRLTLIESSQKKSAFLREVVRRLGLSRVEVFPDRAENFPAHSSDLVTLRAVERFDSVLPVAARLASPNGRLALLIGSDQVARACQLAPDFHWLPPHPIPLSDRRILLIAELKGSR